MVKTSNCYLFAAMRKVNLVLLLLILSIQTKAMKINYTIDIQNPNTHYALVKLEISEIKESRIVLKMPVWTPGSYMVREFERNIEQVSANSNKKNNTISKVDKSTWAIENKSTDKTIEVTYKVYCFENTVRTSYIDNDHAFLLLSSCLMYADKQGSGTLDINYPEAWTKISTTLIQSKPNLFLFNSYDELIDSPIEIGTHQVLKFEVEGVPHTVALVGKNNCPTDKFKTDLQKICSTMYQIVGKHPCKEYLFIIHHVEEGGGGLEHANSNVVQMQRFAYTNKDRYLNFLSLCAHEYFHLWNVKRIRPEALGPFDYSKENYTNLLWVAEGITSYYDELAMYRAGFRTESEYLRILSNTFSATINRKGAEIQSMHEASFDAWIKEYRPNENSINTNISYYMKGAAIAALLDIELLDATKGSKGLDHLLQYLYSEYYEKKQRGFTDNEFYDAVDYIAGKPLNFKSWAEETNTSETNQQIKNILKKVACSIENKVQNNLLYTGINTEQKGEKIAVKSIDAMSAAFGLDIQAGDEIIAINKIRIKTSLDEAIRLIGEGVKLDFIISRNGLIRDLTIVPVQNPKLDLSISIDKGDDPILLVWLKRI
jgi:predicted metalloprotease with PDZ domain